MSERFEVPKTSPEIANQVYQEFRNNMTGFTFELSPQIEEEQPVFLDANLEGGVAIMLAENPLPATLILAGSFFRYECSRRELQLRGEKLPFIGRETFVKSLEPVRELKDLTVQFGRSDAMLRRMAVQLTNEDPAIGAIVNKLLESPLEVQRSQGMDAFIQGVHTAHTNLANIDYSTPPLDPSVSETSKIPPVRRSLVRQALFRVINNPEGFTDAVMDFLGESITDMAARIHYVGEKDYKLLSAFTSFCIIGEIQERGSRLRVIQARNLSHPDPRIAELLHKKYPTADERREIEQLLRSFNIGILDEIGNTNPHLHWGVTAFLNPLSELDPGRRLSAGMNGIVHQYNTLKAILR